LEGDPCRLCVFEDQVEVFVEMVEIATGMLEVIHRMRDVFQGVLEFVVRVGFVVLGVGFVLFCVVGLVSAGFPVGEGMFEVLNEMVKVLECVGGILLCMFQVFDGVREVMPRVAVVLNRMVHFGGGLAVGGKEVFDFGAHGIVWFFLVLHGELPLVPENESADRFREKVNDENEQGDTETRRPVGETGQKDADPDGEQSQENRQPDAGPETGAKAERDAGRADDQRKDQENADDLACDGDGDAEEDQEEDPEALQGKATGFVPRRTRKRIPRLCRGRPRASTSAGWRLAKRSLRAKRARSARLARARMPAVVIWAEETPKMLPKRIAEAWPLNPLYNVRKRVPSARAKERAMPIAISFRLIREP